MSLQEDLHEARKRPRKTHKAGHKPLNKQLIIAAVVVFGLVLAFYSGSWLFTDGEDDSAGPAVPEAEEAGPGAVDVKGESDGVDETKPRDAAEEPPQNYAPAVIAGLDAGYYIDYTGGTIPLGDLPIGARVVDPSWEWEFRTGGDYTLAVGDEIKPVAWIVVSKNHYKDMGPHVTLITREVIGRYAFDDSTDKSHRFGTNQWSDTGTGNASHGIRTWLNSSGNQSDQGFFRAFSDGFRRHVVLTILPNKNWYDGSSYTTKDAVFIPSTTEIGEKNYRRTYKIGNVFTYFSEGQDDLRIAQLTGKAEGYWTRSPDSGYSYMARRISDQGCFTYQTRAYYGEIGVRAAINLSYNTPVSPIIND